tara:strand:+ start:43861 stop:44739 length:879 start_codon:yes stop_codon:yes gene_type:complete
MAKILVTGAGGLLGADVSTYLRSKGHNIIGVVRQKDQVKQNNICIDLSEPKLELTKKLHGIEGVIHTAAVVPNKVSNPNNEQNKIHTQTLDQNIASFCIQEDIPVVYISSCGMYDLTSPLVKSETSPLVEVTPYHSAKISGELLFSRNKKAIVARIPSPYGPNMSAETVLNIFFRKAVNNDEITIWGSGKREQDFIHVRDISKFIERAIFSNEPGIYNVCSGKPISMIELAQECVKVCGAGKIITNDADCQEENYYPYFSTEKAKNILSWSHEIAITQGIESLLKTWKNDHD